MLIASVGICMCWCGTEKYETTTPHIVAPLLIYGPTLSPPPPPSSSQENLTLLFWTSRSRKIYSSCASSPSRPFSFGLLSVSACRDSNSYLFIRCDYALSRRALFRLNHVEDLEDFRKSHAYIKCTHPESVANHFHFFLVGFRERTADSSAAIHWRLTVLSCNFQIFHFCK